MKAEGSPSRVATHEHFLRGSAYSRTMKITSKGQVTIPQEIRKRFGLLPHTEATFRVEGDRVFLERVESRSDRGQDLVRRMRGTATVRMTTAEIMALTRD